jgi:hypothetical protein
MASMPTKRMGPPPRSLATDAHNCIMVWIPRGSTEYKVVATMIGATTWQARLRSFCQFGRGSVRLAALARWRPRTSTNRRPSGKPERVANFALGYVCSVQWLDTIVARRALSPSTPRAFRRDPSGSGGLTAQRGQAKGVCRAINAELRSHEAPIET